MPTKGHHTAYQFPHFAFAAFDRFRKRQPQPDAKPFQERPALRRGRIGSHAQKVVKEAECRLNLAGQIEFLRGLPGLFQSAQFTFRLLMLSLQLVKLLCDGFVTVVVGRHRHPLGGGLHRLFELVHLRF